MLTPKRVLGNSQYSNPMTRRQLIQIGASSEDMNIRVAANLMAQDGLEEEKSNLLSDEVIDYMILLDKNYREVNKEQEESIAVADSCQQRDEVGGEAHDN